MSSKHINAHQQTPSVEAIEPSDAPSLVLDVTDRELAIVIGGTILKAMGRFVKSAPGKVITEGTATIGTGIGAFYATDAILKHTKKGQNTTP